MNTESTEVHVKQASDNTKDKSRIAENFNSAAVSYDSVAVLQHTIADRLLERLELIRINPGRILDLGSGTGRSSRKLAKRYGKTRVVQTDLAHSMAKFSKQHSRSLFSRHAYVCADAEMLPFSREVFDIVYSSLMLQWCNDLDVVLGEVKSVMKHEGLFIFSSFGPDTLKELRNSWSLVDNDVHVNEFIDMHDVGDALVRAGFENPVLESEFFTLTYDNVAGVFSELRMLGAGNTNSGRRRTLSGKNAFKKMIEIYEQYRSDGKIPVTYEAVYGHAWKRKDSGQAITIDGTVRVPVTSIKKHHG